MSYEVNKSKGGVGWVIAAILIFIMLVLGGCYAYPQYSVYQQRLEGQAILAHAQSSREVAVAEAKAKNEAAELLAQAEVTRARGVAAANQIIACSLTNDLYLRYLWINEVAGKDVNKTVVYVPTEANLPVLEANRHPGQ